MACFSYDNSLGLNQISLFQLNYNRDNHTHKRNNIEIQMDKKSGLSRIPKLSSKAVAEGNRVPSRGSTPVGGSRYSVKSAPASQEASPVVSRSKSLRLPRKQYGASGLSSNSASKMDSVTGSRNVREKESSSSAESSRPGSPGYIMATDHTDFVRSAEVNSTKLGNESPFLRRRAQSFGSHAKGNRNPKPTSHLRPPNSRGNTPTPSGTRSVTPSSLPVPSSRRVRGGSQPPSSPRHVRSRSNIGTSGHPAHRSNSSTLKEEDEESSKGRRTDLFNGSGGPRGNGKSVRPPNGTRGKRPTSYVANEPADLNQLALEITNFSEGDLDTPEVKSGTKVQSTARHRELTSSTPSGRVGVASSKPSWKTRSISSHAPLTRRTKYNLQEKTPENGVSGLEGSQEEKTTTFPPSRRILNSRSSTPSSGRSTPVGGILGERKAKISPTNETTPAGGQSRLPGPGFRTAQKIFRVREARPVGINELEGAVLMDADEYLRISHEVKALKTAMLKLKRELQTDQNVSNGTDSTPLGSTPLATKTPRRSTSGTQVNDLTKKVNQLTAEKSQAQEEVSKHMKEVQRLSEQLTRSRADFKKKEEENVNLSQRLQQMENHRDLLLDKVERLHADKNKLEDRLTSLEKVQFYEETSSWLDEVDGGGGEWEESLMLGGVKGERTESDIGENSDPESSAVCGGPHS